MRTLGILLSAVVVLSAVGLPNLRGNDFSLVVYCDSDAPLVAVGGCHEFVQQRFSFGVGWQFTTTVCGQTFGHFELLTVCPFITVKALGGWEITLTTTIQACLESLTSGAPVLRFRHQW